VGQAVGMADGVAVGRAVGATVAVGTGADGDGDGDGGAPVPQPAPTSAAARINRLMERPANRPGRFMPLGPRSHPSRSGDLTTRRVSRRVVYNLIGLPVVSG
jgi:hypothetical protein